MAAHLNKIVKIRMSEGEVVRIDQQARKEKVSRAEYIRAAMRRAVRTPQEKRMEETLVAAAEQLSRTAASVAAVEQKCGSHLSDQDWLRLMGALSDAQDAYCEARKAALECMAPDVWRRR